MGPVSRARFTHRLGLQSGWASSARQCSAPSWSECRCCICKRPRSIRLALPMPTMALHGRNQASACVSLCAARACVGLCAWVRVCLCTCVCPCAHIRVTHGTEQRSPQTSEAYILLPWCGHAGRDRARRRRAASAHCSFRQPLPRQTRPIPVPVQTWPVLTQTWPVPARTWR